MESPEERLTALEQRIKKLEGLVATSETPVLGFAVLGALIAYIAAVANFPFQRAVDSGFRFGVGVGGIIVGCVILVVAVGFTKFAMRAMVEIMVVLLALGNALCCVWVASSLLQLEQWVASVMSMNDGGARFATLALAAIILFVVDVVILSMLYPTARAAGSSVLD